MTTKNPTIRAYDANDKATLLHLLELNTPKYFAPSEKEDLEHYLESEIELYYVLSVDEKIVGCGGINFEQEKTVGIISWDIIHPDHQGKSLGSLLLQHRLNHLKSMEKIEKIIVRTSQHTHLFYEKQGFVLRETIANYWSEGFDLYFMEYTNNNKMGTILNNH